MRVTGKFVLYPVPVGSYTLVLTNPTRATAAVTGVPVVAAAAPTIVGAASAPLLPPAAASAPRVVIRHRHHDTTGIGFGARGADAGHRADAHADRSRLGRGRRSRRQLLVDAAVGAHRCGCRMRPTPSTLPFGADNSAAGLYTLQATSGGVTKNQPIDAKAAVLPPVLFTFP